jgi:hypothetical protein
MSANLLESNMDAKKTRPDRKPGDAEFAGEPFALFQKALREVGLTPLSFPPLVHISALHAAESILREDESKI